MGFSVLELSKLLLYEFYYKRLEPYWQNKVHLHYMDTDSFVLSFNANNQQLLEFLERNKDEFDFSEEDKSHELYDPISQQVIGNLKVETSPVLLLDSCKALRSKSYSFRYIAGGALRANTIQKGKQKGIQHTPRNMEHIESLFNSETKYCELI